MADLRSKGRNAELYLALQAVGKNPEDQDVRERWVLAAQDLTHAVLNIQFASLKNSPDREDLAQAALVEFHRIAPKLSALTERFTEDGLFRVLYSVAKFSMLREWAKLKKHHPVPSENGSGIYRVDDIPEEGDPEHPVYDGHHDEAEARSWERYIHTVFPLAVVAAVDSVNVYALTPWGEAIRFCALQRIKGRYVSAEFIRSMWKHVPDPLLAVAYADFVARAALLKIGVQ